MKGPTEAERRAALLLRLGAAEFCCYACGRIYGSREFQGPAPMHSGRCDVCGREGCLTGTTAYGELRPPIDLTEAGRLFRLRRMG